MKKQLSLLMVAFLTLAAFATAWTVRAGEADTNETITATWDFQNLIPESMADVNIQGTKEADVPSNVDGIVMHVISNGGKLAYNSNGYAQFNTNTTLQVPVRNKGDEVTLISYPGQSNYSVGGEDATGQNTFVHKATAEEAVQGYVEVVATKTAYIYSIETVLKAPSTETVLVEKTIIQTNFQDWKKSSTTSEVTTRFTDETITFTYVNTTVDPDATNEGKFSTATDPAFKGYIMAAKSEASVTTSTFKNITRVRYRHGATGSNRGWGLMMKAEGDEEWTLLSDEKTNSTAWIEKDVNKDNVQLMWYNLNTAENAYMFELQIFANVDLSGAPLLGSFKANGQIFIGDDFEMGNDGCYHATFELPSAVAMVSAENPITDVMADNGEVGTITYDGDADQCVVTIPVTANEQTVNYVATFVRKPMLTLTYIGIDGQTVGTQQVEKDSKIGSFSYSVSNLEASREGYKVRGWFKQNRVGEKYTTESVISEPVNLYAIETEIEVASTSRKYEFDLTDPYFDAEDHEAFMPEGKGKWHDATHGWVFSNGDKISLLVGPKAMVSFVVCRYSAETAKIVCGQTELSAYSATDGDVVVYQHDGQAGTLSFDIVANGAVYIHSIKIVNTAETNYTADGNWFFVKQGDASSFIDALDYVNGLNATADSERRFIFLPNGTYDLGEKTLTQVSGHNISIIGESMEGVVIKNSPVKEGIGITATLLNTGTNNYFQDLTLNCIAPYGSDPTVNGERGVCLQDKGSQTICKNVYLKGLQDTYYINNNNATCYFEGGRIEGTVDYVCGNGDVYFNEVLFYCTLRSNGSGNACVAAPNTPKNFGYIFNKCTIDGASLNANNYRLGRPWASNTIVRMLDTKMVIKPSAEGWSEWSDDVAKQNSVVQFAEYNSVDADGNAIDLSKRKKSFKGEPNNPVITAEEAADYRPEAIFTEWRPFDFTEQLQVTGASLADGTVTWAAVEGASAYAVFVNGELMGITQQPLFNVSELKAGDVVTIRTANGMGGFGTPVQATIPVGINAAKVSDGQHAKSAYNMAGQPVDPKASGLIIVNGKKLIVTNRK